MKTKHIGAALLAILLAPILGIARAIAPQGIDAINTQGTFDGGITRTAEGAISPHLLVTNGTTAGTQMKLCTASTRPIATAYDELADGAKGGFIPLLGGEPTRIVIASKAIAAGVRVYATAGGKVTDAVVAGAYLVGESLTAGAADGSEMLIMPLSPVVNP